MSQSTFPLVGQQIVVVGNTGSGKTTLARQLGQLLDLPHTELDAIHWGPNWTALETAVFRQHTTEATNSSAWIVDGNYSKVRDIIWALKKQWSRRREYPRLLKQPEYEHLTAVRLKSPRQTQNWLSTLNCPA